MPDKLTDSEIMEALKHCANGEHCRFCGFRGITGTVSDCSKKFLDLINRLQAENEELVGNIDKLKAEMFDKTEQLNVELQAMRGAANSYKAENERLRKAKYIFSTVDYCADDLDKALKENEELKSAINGFREYEDKIKAEAYKEFAERLKTEYAKGMNWFKKKESYYVDVSDIDNLLKELVGEEYEMPSKE